MIFSVLCFGFDTVFSSLNDIAHQYIIWNLANLMPIKAFTYHQSLFYAPMQVLWNIKRMAL